MNYGDNSPIIACATGGFSTCAVHLIRLSGFENINQFDCFSIEATKIKNRYAHFVKILDRDKVLDEVVLTFFQGPYSYNGENILEISVHGNPLNVQRIIRFFKEKYHFRDAYGGEFSYRALKNKKLTLSQIEGLDLFLNAQSIYSLNQGFSLLAGDFQESFKKLYDDYIRYKASIELMIDFAEDVGESAFNNLKSNFYELKKQIEKLNSLLINSSDNLIQPEVVILGKPNAGKSTLFNLILKRDRAIVSNQAGTTRDYLSEDWVIKGNRFDLVDTAGLREVDESIEKEGIKKAKQKIERAFFKILVSKDLVDRDTDYDFFIQSHQDGINEIDSNQFTSNLLEDNKKLISLIENQINKKFEEITSQNPILLDRQKGLIKKINEDMMSYEDLIENTMDMAILDSELQIIGEAISELIGVVNPESVLQHIFKNFCIGK